MTIQELINIIPFKILQRGQDYFDNGNIYFKEITDKNID